VDRRYRLEDHHDAHGGDERDGEVHELECDLLDGEDHFVDANLLDEGLRIDDRAHGSGRSSAHVVEHDISEDEVYGERASDVELEDLRKDYREHDHHEQGIQQAP